MATPGRAPLQVSKSVTLNASGTGQVSLAPDDSRGPARWYVQGLVIQTNRPGVAPIPKAQVYLGPTASPAYSLGLTYDGSFNQATSAGGIVVNRGDSLIIQWTGGQAGDIATATITGEKGN